MEAFYELRRILRQDKFLGSLVLLCLSVPLLFSVFLYENFETVKYSLFLILSAGVFFIFIKQEKFQFNKRVFYILIGLIFLALVSSLFSLDRLYSFFGTYYRFTGSFIFYLVLFLLILVLSAGLNKQRWEILFKVLFFDALIIALVGILQSLGLGYYQPSTESGFLRAPSLLGNPNFSTMFMIGALPLGISAAITSKNLKAKIYYCVSIFLIVFSCATLSSRGSLAGLFIGLACFFMLYAKFEGKKIHNKKYFIVIFFSLLIAVLGFFQITRPSSLKTTLNFSDENVQLRFQVWTKAVGLMLKHPILGFGPSTFHLAFEENRNFEMAGQNGLFDDAHNLFLQIGSTLGIPFLAAFLLLIGLALLEAFKVLQQKSDINVIAAFCGLLGLLFSTLFNPVTVACFLLLAVLLGFLLSESSKNLSLFLGKKFTLIIKLCLLFFALLGIQLFVAEQIFYFAYQNYFTKNYRTTLILSKISSYINPGSQLYPIYEIGSQIKLKAPTEEIIANIENLKATHSKQAKTYAYAANLYHNLYLESNQEKYLQSAIKDLKLALEIDPYFSERYAQVGLYYFESGDLPNALKFTRYALSLNDKYLPAWILSARIYQLQENFPKTIEALHKAYTLKSESMELRYLWYYASHGANIARLPIRINVASGALE
jgi:O-antigen ligase